MSAVVDRAAERYPWDGTDPNLVLALREAYRRGLSEAVVALTGCPRCDLEDTSAQHNGQGDCVPRSTERCPKCGVTVTDQTPSAFYLAHDEQCGGELNESSDSGHEHG